MNATEHLDRALTELDASNRRLLAVCDLTVALGGVLDLATAVRTLSRESARLLAVRAAYVVVETDDRLLGRGHPFPADGIVVPLLQHARTATTDPSIPVPASTIGLEGDAPTLVLPLVTDGRTVGAVALVDPVSGAFDAADLWLALTVSACGSRVLQTIQAHRDAVHGARLDAEYAAAGHVQRQLLPVDVPLPQRVTVATRSRPALGVGGDLLDHRVTANGRYLAVGDVTGKGMSAGLLASVIQLATRRWIGDLPAPRPSTVVAAVADECGQTLSDVAMFTTLAVAHLDADERILTVASAGQSPVLVRRDGEVRVVMPTAPPIGIVELPDVEQRRFHLAPGDAVLIGTDGLLDQRDRDGGELGLDGLCELLAEATGDAEAVLASILDAVDRHGDGAEIDDDVTVAVLVVPGGAA